MAETAVSQPGLTLVGYIRDKEAGVGGLSDTGQADFSQSLCL